MCIHTYTHAHAHKQLSIQTRCTHTIIRAFVCERVEFLISYNPHVYTINAYTAVYKHTRNTCNWRSSLIFPLVFPINNIISHAGANQSNIPTPMT